MPQDSTVYHVRLHHFADGWLVIDPAEPEAAVRCASNDEDEIATSIDKVRPGLAAPAALSA